MGPKSAMEAVSSGNVASAHTIAHNELLVHLRKVADASQAAEAKAAEAGPSGTTAGATLPDPLILCQSERSSEMLNFRMFPELRLAL